MTALGRLRSSAVSFSARWQALARRRPWLGRPVVRFYAPMLVLFATTRLVIHALGVRFNLDLAWMFLADPAALQHRLLETVFYFHAFAPGTNLLTGALLKVAPDHLSTSAAAVFHASGYLLFVSLFHLGTGLGLRRGTALGLTLAFSLLPQSIYFENLYLYTHLCTSLLCLGALLFVRALRLGSATAWLWFFLVCATLGWLYTTFHIAWFGLMLAAGLLLAGHGRRRRVLLGALAPGVLILALYLKNYLVFGVFGATSWGGANLTLATTHRMPAELKSRWIREGKLSPFAGINVFAGPEQYLRFFPPNVDFPWPGSNELARPSVNAPNYNHGLFLEVNRRRREDSSYFIEARPGDYASTVLGRNLPGIFGSSTRWHPNDRSPRAPHYQHRQVLGGYEQLYDRIVHRFPIPGVGLYVFLLPVCLWAAWVSWVSVRRRRRLDVERRSQATLLGFCLLQVCFVVSASCVFTSQEASRYRYGVEPFIWVLSAAGIAAARAKLAERGARRALPSA